MPDIQDISVEDVVADGIDLGKTPQEIAAGVHRWRSLTQEWAATAHGDTDPRRYSEGMDKLDEITTGALAGLRQAAASSWLQTNFQDQPDHARDFLASYDVNQGQPQALGGYSKQAEELNSLAADPVWQLPKRRRDWLSIKEPGGNQIGTFQILPKGEGLDILLNYKSGQENKHGRLNIAPVTDDDIKADIAKTQTELEQARRDIQSSLSNAEMPPAFSGDMGFGAAAGADWAVQEAEQRAQQKALRLQTLSGPTARDFLTSERVVEAVKQSPHGKAIGQVALGEDFLRGVAGFYGNTRVAWNDVTNDPEERDLWRGYMSQLKEIMPGSTRLRLNGGVGNFASEAVEGLGGMTPQLATMAATLGSSSMAGLGFTSVQNALRAGGNVLLANSLLQMGVSAYGSNVTDALTRADRLEEDAKKLQASSPEEAANMLRQAEDIRSTYRLTSGLKAASEVGSELIFPEELMLIRGGQSSYGKKLLNAGGKSFVEGVAAELGNQAVNAQAYGEPGSITNLLRAGALEAAAGAPMIAVGSFGGPKQNAPDAQPNAASVQPTPPAPGVDPNSMAAIAARAGTQEVTWPTGRRPILTDVPDGPPAIQTAPERTETIQEQLSRTAEGKKPATFIPTQTQADVTIPDGLVSTPVNTPEPGVMVHRSEMSPAEVLKAAEEAPGLLMGMGIPDKPADADRAIVLRTADGTPVLDVAANSETEPQVREALQKMAKEGDSITVESPAAVLQERAGQPRTAARVGEVVTWEGYTGRLIQDGARFAIQTPAGETVEVPNLQEVQRADLKATQAQALAELQQQSQTVEVQESSFQAAPEGSLAIVDSQGNTFVPHNPKLLRSVRPGANGTTEVLVRNPKQPGQVIKLTGKQAANAQDAFIQAAANVEAAGGKVNWGTPAKPRFQFSTSLQTVWSQLKTISGPPLRFITSGKAALIEHARNVLTAGPRTVKAPDGRTVLLVHNRQGAVDTLFTHLVTESDGRPSPERAAWVGRIANTIQNAAVRIQSGKNIVYIARYAERGGARNAHFVIVSPDGQVVAQGPASHLTTHWARTEAKPGQKPRPVDKVLFGFSDLDATVLQGKSTSPAAADSGLTTGMQGNVSVQSSSTPGYTVWVNPESGITESQVPSLIDEILNAPAQAPTSLLASLKGSLTSLQKAAADAVRILNSQMPGLVSTKVKIFTTVQEFLDSGHLNKDELTPDILAKIQSAEGFYDNLTGDTIVIGENVNLEPGETPRSAVARVILHERVGHEGLNILLATDPEFAARWERFTAQIPETELTAIGTEKGYEELAGDRNLLAFEWFARQVRPGLMSKNPYVNQIWFALKSWLKNVYANFAGHGEFNKELHAIIKLAQQAAINGTADPTTPQALASRFQFSLGGTRIFHRQGQPYRVNNRGWRAILTGTTLPRAFVDTVATSERERRALDQAAAQLGQDLDAAVQSYAQRSGRPMQEVYDLVNQALSGAPGTNAVLMQADTALHTRALRARTFLDDLSQAVATTLPTGELRNTIVLNQGAWMKRSYAAFDPASGWNYDTVMQAARDGRDIAGRPARQIVARAMRYLRQQNPQRTRAQLEADMRDLMDRDSWAGYLAGESRISKDVSSLMARQSLPVEIRALMGEEHNPIKRFGQSASFQAQFLHRHQQQAALRTIGLNTGLFASQRGGVYTQQIPADNPRWSPLAGIWTTPQLWASMQEMDGLNTGNNLWAKAGEALKWLGSEAKFNRVAANPDSWLVNALGNAVALVQTGDLFYSSFFRRVGDAVALYRSGRAKSGEAIQTAQEAVTDAQRAMLSRLTASGVMGETFTLRDLEASLPRHMLQWVAQDNTRERLLGGAKGALWGQAAGRGLGIPGRVVGGVIGAAAGAAAGYTNIQNAMQRVAEYVMTGPDAIGRLTGFLGNYETALAAGMTPDAAFTHASDRTRNTFPDYGRMPELLKTLSRYGVAGSFIGFQYEVYRNFAWNIRYAVQDLRSGNAPLVRKGIARAIGAATVGTLAAGGLQAIFQGLAGTDDDRNRKWRKWFAAPWEKNAVIVFTDYTPEGVSYFNTSYILPQATIAELAEAARSGEDPADAAGRVVAHVWEQFMGSSVHLQPILAALNNQDRAGRPLTYKDGFAGALERLDEAQKTILEPGWAAKLERLEYALRGAEKRGRLFSVDEEAKRVLGIREFTRTWPDLVKRGYDNLAAKNTAIRSQANKVLGDNLPGAQNKAINEANAAIQALTAELQNYESDLISLGVPETVVRKARKESSIPKRLKSLEMDREAKNRVKSAAR